MVMAQQPVEAAEVILRRARDVGATSPARAWSTASWSARSPSAASSSRCGACPAEFDDVFLPLYGAHQAHNAATALAAVEAFLGAGPRRRDAGPGLVREALRQGDLAGPAGGRAPGADGHRRRLAQPGRRAASPRPRWPRSSPSTTWSAVVAAMRDKDVAGMLEILEPVLAEIVVTRNSSRPLAGGLRARRPRAPRCSAPTASTRPSGWTTRSTWPSGWPRRPCRRGPPAAPG